MRRRQKNGRRQMSEKNGMLTRQLQKNNIETGRGYWKSLAAAPLGVGACVSRQNRDFT